jgi:hypothetical protein
MRTQKQAGRETTNERKRRHAEAEQCRHREQEREWLAKLEIENEEIRNELRKLKEEQECKNAVVAVAGGDAEEAVTPAPEGNPSEVAQSLQTGFDSSQTLLCATAAPARASQPGLRAGDCTQGNNILK